MVLHHRRHYHVGGGEAEPIGEVVDGLRGIAAQDGQVRSVLVAPGEGQHRPAALFVGVSGPSGPEARSPVDARVPRQELGHPIGNAGVGLRGCSLVELDGDPLDATQAGDDLSGTDQLGQGGGVVVGRRPGGTCGVGVHAPTLRDAPDGRGTLKGMQTEWSPERNDEYISGFSSSAAPAEPFAEDVAPIPDPAPDHSASGDTITVITAGVDDGMPATHVDAAVESDVDTSSQPDAASDDGVASEEEAHRSEVDAVDQLLDEVELAMARLDDGTYGRCETCGVPIDDVELSAGPLVRECTPCSTGVLAFEDA
jgi:DnaK suppressor protein